MQQASRQSVRCEYPLGCRNKSARCAAFLKAAVKLAIYKIYYLYTNEVIMKYKNAWALIIILFAELLIQYLILRFYPSFNYTSGPILIGITGGTAAIIIIGWQKLRKSEKTV